MGSKHSFVEKISARESSAFHFIVSYRVQNNKLSTDLFLLSFMYQSIALPARNLIEFIGAAQEIW